MATDSTPETTAEDKNSTEPQPPSLSYQIILGVFGFLALGWIIYTLFFSPSNKALVPEVDLSFSNSNPAEVKPPLVLMGTVIEVGTQGDYLRIAVPGEGNYSLGLKKDKAGVAAELPIDLLQLAPLEVVRVEVVSAKATDSYDYFMTDISLVTEELTVDERIKRAEKNPAP